MPKYTNIEVVDGKYFCAKCGNDLGNDLSVPGTVVKTLHMDGARFYINEYKCCSCGAEMSIASERSSPWWEDGE